MWGLKVPECRTFLLLVAVVCRHMNIKIKTFPLLSFAYIFSGENRITLDFQKPKDTDKHFIVFSDTLK